MFIDKLYVKVLNNTVTLMIKGCFHGDEGYKK